MIFISHKEIDIHGKFTTLCMKLSNLTCWIDTSQFDKFTKHDYDQYVANKLHKDSMLKDTDPAAWFTLTDDKTSVINLDFRFGLEVNLTFRVDTNI